MGRSRSPRRNLSIRWISKAIVTFERWPKRRHVGLHVDEKGSYMFNELIDYWTSDLEVEIICMYTCSCLVSKQLHVLLAYARSQQPQEHTSSNPLMV